LTQRRCIQKKVASFKRCSRLLTFSNFRRNNWTTRRSTALLPVTVETSGEYHTVRVGEAAVPAAMHALIDWLMKTARKA
jgi:hypothetical protein